MQITAAEGFGTYRVNKIFAGGLIVAFYLEIFHVPACGAALCHTD